MKTAITIFAACVLVVLSATEEEPATTGETFTQTYPFAQRAFFYYPAGAGGYFNRPGQAPGSVDFVGNPYEADVTTAQDMVRPAAFFVPTSDLLTMPYPSKNDQEADEQAAMKHLEMLKELHDQLENSEQRFLLPSISMMGNGVNIPTTNFLALLNRLSKTVTKVITTTITTSITVEACANTTFAGETTTTNVSTQPTIEPVILGTETIEPNSTPTTTLPLETTPVILETTQTPLETTTTPLATITTSTPVTMVTTITSTLN